MGTLTLDFEKHTSRSCGSCSLCCKLLPQKELAKPALTRCQHQRHSEHGSCNIYATRPPSCQLWACAWLNNADTGNLSRPDRSHVVVDIMPDVIRIDDGQGNVDDMEALVIWVDPLYPDAWRHPSLLNYFNERAKVHKLAVLVRYGSSEGFVAFPPATTGYDEWIERNSQKEWVERSAGETVDRLAALR